MNEYADNTRKNYLNAIIVSLQAVDGKKEVIEKFIKERDDVSKKYREGKTIGEMNEKEKKNIISLDAKKNILGWILWLTVWPLIGLQFCALIGWTLITHLTNCMPSFDAFVKVTFPSILCFLAASFNS